MDLIERLKEKKFLKFIYWCARVCMGLTFIISGVRKLPGIKFTSLLVDHPVGAYFKAMYETGFYWNIIGYFQIIIGVLIFFNRFVIMPSLLMFPVGINIFLISMALKMQDTR